MGFIDVIVLHDPISTTHDQSSPRSNIIRFATIYINTGRVNENKADLAGDRDWVPAYQRKEKTKLQ